MPETGPEAPSHPAQPPPPTQQPPPPAPKESPFSIKNLLNGDHPKASPKQPRAFFPPGAKGALEGAGFAFSQMGDLAFPRFEIPAQRFALPAHYLERTPAWWYPYSLTTAGGHLPRPEGTGDTLTHSPPPSFPSFHSLRPGVGVGNQVSPAKKEAPVFSLRASVSLKVISSFANFSPIALLPRLCSPWRAPEHVPRYPSPWKTTS